MTNIDRIQDPVGGDELQGKEAADLVNGFFCRVSCSLAKKFSQSEVTPPQIPQVCCFGELDELSDRRVREQIQRINTEKSYGLLDLPAGLLKIALRETSVIFTRLLNICIEKLCSRRSGSWPL